MLSRDQLLDLTKGRSAVAFDRSVDVQLSRLRRKLEPDPTHPTLIKTVRGGGYLFAPAVAIFPDVPRGGDGVSQFARIAWIIIAGFHRHGAYCVWRASPRRIRFRHQRIRRIGR